jgi:hypothetical protein
VPATSPLLAELNLKLIRVSPLAGSLAIAPATAASPTPGGHSAVAHEALALGLSGLATAPFGLVATVAEEFDSDDDFLWDGGESGVEFGNSSIAHKSNNDAAFYPSCNHVLVEAISPVSVCPVPTVKFDHDKSTILPLVLSSHCIVLSKKPMSLIHGMSASLILPGSSCQFTVADLGATNHMFPDKSAFISYKLVSNLHVCMGNNSHLPVLGCSLAIISLDGQHILVRNALHVLGLVVPLYTLRAHFIQPGCGFIVTSGVDILVYFPIFVFLVNTSKDCHLSFESLG